ncbi:hypothetical protein AVEN_178517-1 [Araneus ventricosus]|uniref:Uncharacterized protein n=1 Tax=Araneus ventricosus TaxID=182803 RepID=A0A4Y2CDW0_ARAVE|nr:hypothetical protein AVEN_178517-1 [Araneus ventricosus]
MQLGKCHAGTIISNTPSKALQCLRRTFDQPTDRASKDLSSGTSGNFKVKRCRRDRIHLLLQFIQQEKISNRDKLGERKGHCKQPPYPMTCCWNISTKYCGPPAAAEDL